MLMRKELTTEEKMRRFQMQILFFFVVVIIAIATFLTSVILTQSGEAMREKASSLIAANSRQLELNINSYLNTVETTATLLFADEDYYLYDETDETIEEYDRVKLEGEIRDRIVDLGLMENFSDFCIIYSDDNAVGWLSKSTAGLFPDGGIYDTFSSYISDEKTNDGWCFGVQDNTDRMYYVKRLNLHAILVTSFYNKELESVFQYPEQLSDLTIRLVNDSNQILFSSVKDEIGGTVPDSIVNLISVDEDEAHSQTVNVTTVTEAYLVTVNVCENGWRVVCSMPTDVLMRENQELQKSIVIFVTIFVVVFVLIGLIIINRITRPMDGMVSNLEEKATIDQLSGLLNKISFEEQVQIAVEEAKAAEELRIHAFVVLDMDNFKTINDTAGHAYGDEVIARMGKLLGNVFEGNILVGRIGGDEFAVYRNFNHVSKERALDTMVCYMDMLKEAFADRFAKENEEFHTSLSLGLYISDEKDVSFDLMYTSADAALYHSKKNGKSQYTLFQEGMTNEQKVD